MNQMKTMMAVVVVAAMATEAGAGNATANVNVSATVTSTCAITAGSLAFGAYDPVAAAAVEGTATVSVSCTKGATAKITLGQGAYAASGSTNDAPVRRMDDGNGNTLGYALYSDSNRQTAWGNTAGTGVSYTAPSSSATQLTIYGRIAGNQDIPAGAYTDTVVATVTF